MSEKTWERRKGRAKDRMKPNRETPPHGVCVIVCCTSASVCREGTAEGVSVVDEEQLREGEEGDAATTQKVAGGGKKGKKSKRKNKAFDDWSVTMVPDCFLSGITCLCSYPSIGKMMLRC